MKEAPRRKAHGASFSKGKRKTPTKGIEVYRIGQEAEGVPYLSIFGLVDDEHLMPIMIIRSSGFLTFS